MDQVVNKDDAPWRAEEVARGERFEFGKNWSRKSSHAASRQYYGHSATERIY
jgi:hypothetical protein